MGEEKKMCSRDLINIPSPQADFPPSSHLTYMYSPLRTVPTNSKAFLRGFLDMREKQILTSVIEIQKENWG